MPMNPEIKAEWVEALRSGDYKQGRGQLCRKTHYGDELCCLGVLSELAAKHGIVSRVNTHEVASAGHGITISYVVPDSNLIAESSYLSRAIREWAGLTEIDPKVKVTVRGADGLLNDQYVSTLSRQNDDGASFQEIAELIENQL